MNINTITHRDIFEYGKHFLWGDADYNTYPAGMTKPQDANEKCECDREYHYGCCACGCGEQMEGYGTYVPGHDQKHYGKLIRRFAAGDLAEKAQVVRDAERWATDGVYYKLMRKFDIRMLRSAGENTFVIAFSALVLVIKVGRWYYPVVIDAEGQAYRSSKTIQDKFDAGHTFDIPLGTEDASQMQTLYSLIEKEEVAA